MAWTHFIGQIQPRPEHAAWKAFLGQLDGLKTPGEVLASALETFKDTEIPLEARVSSGCLWVRHLGADGNWIRIDLDTGEIEFGEPAA